MRLFFIKYIAIRYLNIPIILCVWGGGGGLPVEEMYGIMTKISSVSSQNQLLMLKNAPEFTKIMIGEICTSL